MDVAFSKANIVKGECVALSSTESANTLLAEITSVMLLQEGREMLGVMSVHIFDLSTSRTAYLLIW